MPTTIRLTERDEQRLLAKVGLPDEHGCMPWTASTDQHGYGRIAVMRDGRQHTVKSHRAMHELYNGPIPDSHGIDHICGNRACQAPAHLRAATQQQNLENLSPISVRSKSGIRGVYWNALLGKWDARVYSGGRQHYLGVFATKDEAAQAAAAKRAELYTHNDREQLGGVA